MGRWDAWASAKSEILFDFIDECARCALVRHGPRAWWAIRAMKKGATICQDEWRAWRHRGLVVLAAGMLGRRLERGIACLILSMNVLDVP